MAQVLVIDDDEHSLKALKLVLDGRISARIDTAVSGYSALKLIHTTDFDAIITDIKMPGIDGLALLKQIRAIKPELPVILISAYQESDVLLQAIHGGAYDFVRKPFNADELVDRVNHAILHTASLRDLQKKHKALAERAAELEREVELQESHRLLVESVVDYGFFTLDVNGKINSWNIGAERIKGFRAHEVIGRHFSIFYTPEDIAARKPELSLEIAAREGRVQSEGWRVRKDGSRFWANVTLTVLRNKDGKLRGYGKVTRDLTDYKRAEEARDVLLEEKTARLTAEAVNRAKDQFFATLSHELRSPLTPMLGWTNLLLSGNVDVDTQLRGLTVIRRNVHAQAKLIEDILDLSRVITGKLSLNVRTTNFVRVLEAAIDVVRPSADAKGIRIQSFLPDEAVQLRGDPDRLQQIIWNLLTNAVKFTPNGGSIQTRLKKTPTHLQLEVSDSGIGLRPEFLSKVFERFSQADSSSSRAHGGLGIGLSLVKSLVELHRGSVKAESDGEGKGSTFTVMLPLDGLTLSESTPGAQQKVRTSLSKKLLNDACLLVVEDEEDSRDLIAFALRQAGARVTAAPSVREAIEGIHKNKPDAVISDLGMPHEDGFVLIRKLREIDSQVGTRTPAIALTSFAQDSDRTRCLASGFQMHIPKPIDPAALVLAVSNLLEKE
jgi:hypothetical protein